MIFKKTNSNPLYVNIQGLFSGGTINILNNTGWYCVATKLG
jgi:hypothetical protein